MFKEADDLFEEMRKLHLKAEQRFFDLFAPSRVHHSAEEKWRPAADVYETDKVWVIKMELGGVRKEDISVTLSEGVMRVRGVRRDEFKGEWRTYHQAEINYSAFERSFLLPKGVHGGHIKSTYNHGLLAINVEKFSAPPRIRRKVIIEIG